MLPSNSILIYTDGSRSEKGVIGAGWAIYEIKDNDMNLICENSCCLGSRMEVFDAELHAVYEALKSLDCLDYYSRPIYVCIDNSSAIQVLARNPDLVEGAYQACKAAQLLMKKNNTLSTVWIPSHCGIIGNEKADQMAKQGTEPHQQQCPAAYTSVAWMQRKAHAEFITKWRQRLNCQDISWKYPEAWNGWSFRMARAIYRVYCGRTEVDTKQGEAVVKCKCKEADLSSSHIIGHCKLFDQARHRLRGRHILPAVFTNHLVLDKEWGPRMVNFMTLTRLGFSKELNWENKSADRVEEEDLDMEDFETGIFE